MKYTPFDALKEGVRAFVAGVYSHLEDIGGMDEALKVVSQHPHVLLAEYIAGTLQIVPCVWSNWCGVPERMVFPFEDDEPARGDLQIGVTGAVAA